MEQQSISSVDLQIQSTEVVGKERISVILFHVTNRSNSGAQNNHHVIIFSRSVDCEFRERTAEIGCVCSKIAEALAGQTQRSEEISKDWGWVLWRLLTHIFVPGLGWLKACSAGTSTRAATGDFSMWLGLPCGMVTSGYLEVLWRLRAPRANIPMKKVEGV